MNIPEGYTDQFYIIIRRHIYGQDETVIRIVPDRKSINVTLAEAQAYCRSSEANSRTCTKPENIAYTENYGPWCDTYEANIRPSYPALA